MNCISRGVEVRERDRAERLLSHAFGRFPPSFDDFTFKSTAMIGNSLLSLALRASVREEAGLRRELETRRAFFDSSGGVGASRVRGFGV